MSDIIKQAQDLYKKDKDGWADIYRAGKEDLKFLSDDKCAQWDEVDYKNRTDTGRPAETVDQLGQFIHQVANDVRMNTPTINIIPSGGEATVEDAEVMKGLIRNIEYISSADDAYDTAVTAAIKSSIGFIRVDHDYSDEEGHQQDLYIRRVVNQFAVMIDSSSVEPDGSDAMHGHIIERLSYDQFKKRFPNKEPVSFEAEDSQSAKEGEEVVICEFYIIEEDRRKVGFTDDGSTVDYEEEGNYKASRVVKKRKVKRYTLSGADVLEETTFPGKYIPIVPVYGEEAWEDGKRKLHSLIRKSKGAQRLYNLWKSLEMELLLKQPQAPVLVPAGGIAGFEEDWKNPSKSMALQYWTEVDGKQIPKPERLAPPQIPTGIINAAREAVDDIKATMGIYNASLGDRSNETSGKAINARKAEGDVATYHFGDNLVKSITHVGRILTCAIPEIYDTPRIIRIIGEEEQPKQVGINGEILPEQEKPVDLTKGKYDVKVITGAPFTTQRQETVAALTEVFKAQPELMQIMGDIYFKNSDFAGAQAMAKRMEKVIDPRFLDKPPEQPVQDPEKIQMGQIIQEGQQALQDMQMQIQTLEQEIKSKDFEAKSKEAQSEIKSQIDALKSQEQIAKLTIQNQMKDLEIASLRAQPQPTESTQSGAAQ